MSAGSEEPVLIGQRELAAERPGTGRGITARVLPEGTWSSAQAGELSATRTARRAPMPTATGTTRAPGRAPSAPSPPRCIGSPPGAQDSRAAPTARVASCWMPAMTP